jgi:hypothetical protein
MVQMRARRYHGRYVRVASLERMWRMLMPLITLAFPDARVMMRPFARPRPHSRGALIRWLMARPRLLDLQ